LHLVRVGVRVRVRVRVSVRVRVRVRRRLHLRQHTRRDAAARRHQGHAPRLALPVAGQLERLRRGRGGAPRDDALRRDRERVAIATRELMHLR